MEEFLNLNFVNVFWAFVAPLILMVLDVITGYYNAWKNDEIRSSKMRDGLGKKCAELCYIVLGTLFKFAFGLSAVMYFIILYVCYMEVISLLENCDKLGANGLPEAWRKKVNNDKEGK